jgi:heat shock protein 5
MFLAVFLRTSLASSNPASDSAPVIGIDFGTTFSTVAVVQNGIVNVIPNELGQMSTPSLVSFTDGRIIIGQDAIPQLIENPRNTIFAFKRWIEARIADPDMHDTIRRLPYKLLDKDDQIYVEIEFQGALIQVSTEQVLALFLTKMKTIAEGYLGMEVKDVVLTVPLSFGPRERNTMKAAAEIAGLAVFRFLPEPLAIALSAGRDTPRFPSKPEANIVCFHLGGGTFDVSLISGGENGWRILATAGIARLGGEDFDGRIVDVFVHDFGRGCESDVTAIARLQRAARNVKHHISTYPCEFVELASFLYGLTLHSQVYRGSFESWIDDYLKTIVASMNQVLQDAGVAKSAIDEIWLVGGSTNIPKVQELVKDSFNPAVTTRMINRSTTVASGAAIAGSWQMRDPKAIDAWMRTTNPHSVSIQIDNGTIREAIHRNSCQDCKNTIRGTTTIDYQWMSHIRVFEGDEDVSRANRLINELWLPVPPRPLGEVAIWIEVSVDSDQVVRVSGDYQMPANASDVRVDLQITRARVELEKFLAADERAKEKAMTWTKVKGLLASAKEEMDEDPSWGARGQEYEKMVREIEVRLSTHP